MTDAEKTELLNAIQGQTRFQVFVLVVLIALCLLIAIALWQRREEAEEDARRLENVKRQLLDIIEENPYGTELTRYGSLLIAAGHDRREVRALTASAIQRRAEMFAEPREEQDERR